MSYSDPLLCRNLTCYPGLPPIEERCARFKYNKYKLDTKEKS